MPPLAVAQRRLAAHGGWTDSAVGMIKTVRWGRTACSESPAEGDVMVVLGLILLVIGFLAKIAVLWTLGIILVVVGAVLWILGSTGRAVGGRRHWY